ncbi:MAG: NADH dehydrogenase subunit [Bacteroidetes bacterium]|nr:NADH dehydrogenase subunit [Bacteroidota bacterium]
MNHVILKNSQSTAISNIPLLDYSLFYEHVLNLLKDNACHCVNYYAYKENGEQLRMICCICNDNTSGIYVFSHIYNLTSKPALESLTAVNTGMHVYEREITENFGVEFINHPWNKPVRFPTNGADKLKTADNYPFYSIKSHELHEVGVGPIHAGIIEPGHFRFICNGEKVLHLEIHLGYQHRAVEELFINKKSTFEKTILAESIAGDSVAANATIYAMLMESLGNIIISRPTSISRTIAIELERAAIHTGDLSALCTDVAYQLGSSVFQGLRTTLINTFLKWSGNRFARRLIRAGANPYPLNNELKKLILNNLESFETRFNEMADYMFNNPGVLARFEGTGILTKEQAQLINAVGMVARTCDIPRDIRSSHPYYNFNEISHKAICLDSGDVQARAMLRRLEVTQSLEYIRTLLATCDEEAATYTKEIKLMPDAFAIALTEGWRGEHCHCAVTDNKGNLKHYKIKDPSLHNWMALALVVRKNDISDFPVCNKSFDLSYCGYDL